MRPCFCGGEDLGENGVFPVHDFPVVCDDALCGEPLFPSLRPRSINRIRNVILRSLGVGGADSYSSHAFRLGPSVEIRNSGSNLAQNPKTVGWKSATFIAYLYFVEDEEFNIRPILDNSE